MNVVISNKIGVGLEDEEMTKIYFMYSLSLQRRGKDKYAGDNYRPMWYIQGVEEIRSHLLH